jgi:hypothetical protein
MADEDDEDAWLEGAFLAQEEYDRDEEKWKGRENEMESYFLSQYDTVPYRRDDQSGNDSNSSSSSSSNSVLIAVLVIFGVMLFCFLMILTAG